MLREPSTNVPVLRVVGIGASAGGLDAIKQLLGAVPLDTGHAFVMLQHLATGQGSQLAHVLEPTTSMKVVDITTGERVIANTVYVVPPGVSASLFRGALVLPEPKGGKRPHPPIDALFESLAEVLAERAIGVVLSGTASDGTEGLRAIQAGGSVTLVQDPATAQFDQMPRSAISSSSHYHALATASSPSPPSPSMQSPSSRRSSTGFRPPRSKTRS